MILKIKYNERIMNIIHSRLKTKVDMIELVVEISKFLLIKSKLGACTSGSLYIDSESRRIFISQPNPKTGESRHFSFQFPFRVDNSKFDTEQIILSTYSQDLIIQSSHLQVLKSLMNESIFTQNRNRYGLHFDLSVLIEEKLKELDLPIFFLGEINDLLLDLLLFEPSYIRFDHHSDKANGKTHPLYHFDVFYSQQTTFKVGFDSLLPYSKFRTMMDRTEKECLFLK